VRTTRPILLIEDDYVDTLTMRRALHDLKIANPLHAVTNGEEALERLRDIKQERPGIILLDLNMPRMNGLEFLSIAKADANLRRIPVIILTTSKEESDIIGGFTLGVAGYILKPVDYAQFLEVVQTINRYWTLSELSTV
jgi:CheY-like chemotaxis protein